MTTAKMKNSRRAPDRQVPADRSLPARLAFSLLRGMLSALVCALLLSLLATAIAYASADPDRLVLPLGLGVLALASVTCGLVTRRASHLSPLLCGFLGGLALLILSFVLSWLLPTALRGGFSPAMTWGLRGGTLAFSLLGASMGANLPKKKRRPRRRG